MAGKFSKAAEKIEAQQSFVAQQKQLHEKYKDPELKDVVIKEKSNTFKFTVRMARDFLKTACGIVLVILAAIGMLSLIYPQTRTELLMILNNIWNELQIMI